jgi:regulator of replication initiation timing
MRLDALDLNEIKDEGMRHLIGELLNIIEDLRAEVCDVRAENQRLRDENNRLKGEQGKPEIKGAKKYSGDHGSEKERREQRKRRRGSKKAAIKIDREETLKVDRESLPPDAQFKGYEEVVVQDILICTDNILFHKEKFHSESEGKTYLAALPPGYAGEFGPNLRAQVLVLYYASQMTEPKIHAWLQQIGIDISTGQISNMLIKGHAIFHEEEAASYEAALAACPWQHIDDTGTRVDGDNHHCHVVDSPLATHYRTLPSKSRLSVLKVLLNTQTLTFRVTEETVHLLQKLNVPQTSIQEILTLPLQHDLQEAFMLAWLPTHLPQLNNQQQQAVLSALAIAAYHAQTDFPVLELLVCDDAPQFKLITNERALCWIHEGRHYKKLEPTIPYHRHLRDKFLRSFWAFYHRLDDYRQQPNSEKALLLEHQFDRLFAIQTGYHALDKLITRTNNHKTELLMALHHPEIELHNNPAELGVRHRVRKRKISFGPRVADGVLAWDTFMSLLATTRKLGINFHDYVLDRFLRMGHIPPLADLIHDRAQQLDLDASWQVASLTPKF